MFDLFSSREEILTVNSNSQVVEIDVWCAKVESIWHSSREDWSPNIIVFEVKDIDPFYKPLIGQMFKLKAAHKLKRVCKAWKSGNRHVYFRARLRIELSNPKPWPIRIPGFYGGNILKVMECRYDD